MEFPARAVSEPAGAVWSVEEAMMIGFDVEDGGVNDRLRGAQVYPSTRPSREAGIEGAGTQSQAYKLKIKGVPILANTGSIHAVDS